MPLSFSAFHTFSTLLSLLHCAGEPTTVSCNCELTLFRTPRSVQDLNHEKSQTSFCKILKNKQRRVKILLKSFHLNDHTVGFHPQTKKLEPHELQDSTFTQVLFRSEVLGCFENVGEKARSKGKQNNAELFLFIRLIANELTKNC